MPKVYNDKNGNAPDDAIYVGRPTSWGNPFTHLITNSIAPVKVETREAAIDCYELLLECKTETDVSELIGDSDPFKVKLLSAQAEWIRDHLPSLKGKDLVCWCAPLPCHADVLLKLANKEG